LGANAACRHRAVWNAVLRVPRDRLIEQLVDIVLPPPNADGLSWSRKFGGADGHSDWSWLHFDLVNAQARRTIEAHPELPSFAKLTVCGTDESPRIVTDGEVVAGVLPAYARTGDVDDFELTCWHFAIQPDSLITGRRRATRTLVNMWQAIEDGLAPATPAKLFDLCIVAFAREVRTRLASLDDSLDLVEDKLFEQHGAGELNDLGRRLGAVRREATRLHRALAPLARTFDEGEEGWPAWISFSEHDSGHRLLHSALDDIIALQDHARSLQDELSTRLAEETNRRLYLVSVVTTVLLPATFVTGFFGMNTGGMLWGGDGVPNGTIFATLLCVAAAIITLLLLRLKRLL
jgi:zinc transporter